MTAAWTRGMAGNTETVDAFRYILQVEMVIEVDVKDEGKGRRDPKCLDWTAGRMGVVSSGSHALLPPSSEPCIQELQGRRESRPEASGGARKKEIPA